MRRGTLCSWFCLVNLTLGKFGPHPGGSYGGRRGLSFLVEGKGRQWTQISHRKLKNSISYSVVIWLQEPDGMLNFIIVIIPEDYIGEWNLLQHIWYYSNLGKILIQLILNKPNIFHNHQMSFSLLVARLSKKYCMDVALIIKSTVLH